MAENAQEPELYRNFVYLVRLRAPHYPIVGETSSQRSISNAGRTMGAIQSLADGIGANIPSVIGIVGSAATSNSPGDFENSMVDAVISEVGSLLYGGMAGPIIGTGVSVLRGTNQSLARTDAMNGYLWRTRGLVDTLARLCVQALREAFHETIMPSPVIPEFVTRSGDMFSRQQREAYRAGYFIVSDIIRDINRRPSPQGDQYSKQCLIHLALQSGLTGRFEEDNGRLRRRCERIIKERILRINWNQRVDDLRQWANAA